VSISARTRALEFLLNIDFLRVNLMVERMTARAKTSYSIYGEDLLIQGILDRRSMKTGENLRLSFVDIGAWRPMRGSNTYFLYKKGMYGTAIEPNPYLKKLWQSTRPNDVFRSVACGNEESGKLNIFHRIAASNTLDTVFADEIMQSQQISIVDSIGVTMSTLEEILIEHKRIFSEPFILDIDIEGMDFEIIETFEFPPSLRPFMILIEDVSALDAPKDRNQIAQHLTRHGYEMAARTIATAVYLDKQSNYSE